VEHVCNLTDVDDKIIDKMFQEGKIHRKNITDKYITSFFKGLEVVLDCSTIVTFVELSPINTNPCSF
jgi:cysteinyl-tRNA synthetase